MEQDGFMMFYVGFNAKVVQLVLRRALPREWVHFRQWHYKEPGRKQLTDGGLYEHRGSKPLPPCVG